MLKKTGAEFSDLTSCQAFVKPLSHVIFQSAEIEVKVGYATPKFDQLLLLGNMCRGFAHYAILFVKGRSL